MSAAISTLLLLACSFDSSSGSAIAPPPATEAFSSLTPGADQSASWIAFREFGAWTPEIREQMRIDNPQVDLDTPLKGVPLRLRRSLDTRALTSLQKIQIGTRKAVAVRVHGSVERILPGGNAAPLRENEFLPAGTWIETRTGGSAELVIDNQSILRVRENSRVALESIQDSAKGGKAQWFTQVFLERGALWTKVRRWAGPLVQHRVRLPNGIAGVHGTIFECSARPDHSSEVEVFEGLVGVAGAKSPETLVAQGQKIDLDPQGTAGAVQSISSLQPSPTSAEGNMERLKELRTSYLSSHPRDLQEISGHPIYRIH